MSDIDIEKWYLLENKVTTLQEENRQLNLRASGMEEDISKLAAAEERCNTLVRENSKLEVDATDFEAVQHENKKTQVG